ncbi:unnamed protein product [Mycena citricolor]|uniref:Uncharacterized protein n=1 Tax=Mycena citricolor TaxID=2018698 RepID=A0AAD2HTK1_9AGAR|nr:unnamed protein product [Mycena citricolor]
MIDTTSAAACNPDPPPSPSPVLPGAWPLSIHRRSVTCPSSGPSSDPLHLDHVLDFQQRLVDKMDTNTATRYFPAYDGDAVITPADSLDSELTRVRTDTSRSIATAASASTIYTTRSSPEKGVISKSSPKLKYSNLHNNFPTRIPQPKRIIGQETRAVRFHRQSLSPESQRSIRSQNASSVSPACSINCSVSSSSPVSPMIFASPTSSSFPRPSNRQLQSVNESPSFSYSSSPSWETSFGSDYNDRVLLDISPCPSPMYSAPRQSFGTNRTPSIEISSAPMLTSLSLPGSAETSMSSDMDVLDIRGDISDSAASFSGSEQGSPWTLSPSPLSPALSFGHDLVPVEEDPFEAHILAFPHPDSVSPIVSPIPSSIPEIESEIEYAGDSSAVQYAEAVVSSAWATDGPSMSQVIPSSLLSITDEAAAAVQSPAFSELDGALALDEEQYSQGLSYLPAESMPVKSRGVVGRMKKLVKRFLWPGKSKHEQFNEGVNVNVQVGSTLSSPPRQMAAHTISHLPNAQLYNCLLPSDGTVSQLGIPVPHPPGLDAQKPPVGPLLTSSSYTSGRGISRGTMDPASPDLTAHARPKTLAEIKSKRRLSMPALANLARFPASPADVSRHRPSSALAFHPRPPALSTLRAQAQQANNGSFISAQRRVEIPRSASSADGENIGSYPQPSTSTVDDKALAAKKKSNRRFSLSALSSFGSRA